MCREMKTTTCGETPDMSVTDSIFPMIRHQSSETYVNLNAIIMSNAPHTPFFDEENFDSVTTPAILCRPILESG